jgi:hypothetical protein
MDTTNDCGGLLVASNPAHDEFSCADALSRMRNDFSPGFTARGQWLWLYLNDYFRTRKSGTAISDEEFYQGWEKRAQDLMQSADSLDECNYATNIAPRGSKIRIIGLLIMEMFVLNAAA